jgi:preprotein translocase subunit YajC
VELLVPIAILGVMWFVLLRPQQQRVKQHRSFVASVQVGDEVVTTSGLFGTVTALDDDRARLRIAPDVEVTIARLAIGRPQSTAVPAPPEPPTPDDPE